MSGPPLPPVPPNPLTVRELGRLLRAVAAGLRARTALADRLRLGEAELGARLALARWLGLLEPAAEGSLRLTRRGLELAVAPRRRNQVLARIAWNHPVLARAMPPGGGWPSAGTVAAVVVAADPSLSGEPARLWAEVLLHLLAPVRRLRPPRRAPAPGPQLRLSLPRPRAPVTAASERSRGVLEADEPATYRLLLQALLDEGEVAVAHLGALLEEGGAPASAAGTCAEMALRRGDARRHVAGREDKLVVTAGAVARRDMSDTVATVALSDPDYRAYLKALQAAGRGAAMAGARYGHLEARFARWDRLLFGPDARPREVARMVERLVEGGTLASIPVARPEPEVTVLPAEAPFLRLLGHRHLVVALPPSLGILVGGTRAVNELLAERRNGPQDRTRPSAVDPRVAVHGGLLHPGEPLPRAIPDRVALRARAVERVPHLAWLVAFLLVHRRSRGRVAIRVHRERLRVVQERRDRGAFLDVVDQLMARRGWQVARRYRGGLGAEALKDVAEALGLAVPAAGLLVLDEDLSCRMATEPEDRELHDLLLPLCAGLEEDLASLDPPRVRR